MAGRKGTRLKKKFEPVSVNKARLMSSRPRAVDDEDEDEPQVITPTVDDEARRLWLLENRTIHLDGEINTALASSVIQSIRYLEAQDPKKPIRLMINSPGGYVTDGLAIINTMQNCQCTVETCVYGEASSMASLILCAGDKGHRYAAPNAQILMHQPLSGGIGGSAKQIEIDALDIVNTRKNMVHMYAEQSGMSDKAVAALIADDNHLTPRAIKAMGLIDEVLTQEVYFRMVHGTKVPEHKKIPYPQERPPEDNSALALHFNDLVTAGIQSRPPSNDNATAAPAQKQKKRQPKGI